MRRPRLLLVLAVLVVVAALVGFWLYRRAYLADEERLYVGTWTADRGGVWEIRANRTLFHQAPDPSTREPVSSVFRWSVRRGRLYLVDPDEEFAFDPIKDVAWTYDIVSSEQNRFCIRDISGVVTVLTRQSTP